MLTVREAARGTGERKGRLAMVEPYGHVATGHEREAVEALARGDRLQRSGTQSGTSDSVAGGVAVATVG